MQFNQRGRKGQVLRQDPCKSSQGQRGGRLIDNGPILGVRKRRRGAGSKVPCRGSRLMKGSSTSDSACPVANVMSPIHKNTTQQPCQQRAGRAYRLSFPSSVHHYLILPITDKQKKKRYLVGKVPEGGVVMKGHQQLGAQQAVTSLLGANIQPLTLLELTHTQLHHPIIYLSSSHPKSLLHQKLQVALECTRQQQTAAMNR